MRVERVIAVSRWRSRVGQVERMHTGLDWHGDADLTDLLTLQVVLTGP